MSETTVVPPPHQSHQPFAGRGGRFRPPPFMNGNAAGPAAFEDKLAAMTLNDVSLLLFLYIPDVELALIIFRRTAPPVVRRAWAAQLLLRSLRTVFAHLQVQNSLTMLPTVHVLPGRP